jgi:ATP-dependent DNA helicase RecG
VEENQFIEKKSLRVLMGANPGWKDLAKDCVCLANARGGVIFIGIEDEDNMPPANQNIDPGLPTIIIKRISENTINVGTHAELVKAINSGEYIKLTVLPSASSIASTTDGRYYIRISDNCKPVLPDELSRLLTDKAAFQWETKVTKQRKSDVDETKLLQLSADIKMSGRVSDFVKQKSPVELLEYYQMSDGDYLTNLGVLWVGKRNDRAKISYAPIIQFLKYDETGARTNKIVWDDFSLNPKEMIEAIWEQVPDWKEGVEISDGIFRKFIPNYEEEVIRELIANALAHKPYTTRGDIFINLYPDRLEVHNPGLFPLSVTAQNILHKTVRRNEHLSKIFYDLKLMEREGSGYDKMYEVLLSNGKQLPVPVEGEDRITVTIRKQILKNEVVKLVGRAIEEFQLRQREIICLGLIAQHTSLSAIEFSKVLNLPQQNAIRNWLGRLQDLGLVQSKGKTKGVEYFINPDFLKRIDFKGKTNLKKIEGHRLKELISEDVSAYPNSSVGEIHNRIGLEIAIRKVKAILYQMVGEKRLSYNGDRKWRRYFINKVG